MLKVGDVVILNDLDKDVWFYHDKVMTIVKIIINNTNSLELQFDGIDDISIYKNYDIFKNTYTEEEFLHLLNTLFKRLNVVYVKKYNYRKEKLKKILCIK